MIKFVEMIKFVDMIKFVEMSKFLEMMKFVYSHHDQIRGDDRICEDGKIPCHVICKLNLYHFQTKIAQRERSNII